MKRGGGGFGLVMLVIVMVVVLLLVARSWRSVAPQAIDVTRPGVTQPGIPVDDHGETGAGETVRQGNLPGLQEMKQQTDQHVDQVQEALDESE